MRILILILLTAFFSYSSYGQTEKAELENISKKLEKGEISKSEHQELSNEWASLLKDLDEYPELPYDKERKLIQYEFIQGFPDLDKKTVYNRVLEWAAIKFGSLESALYL
ncbi:MAG: hypothetical protein R6U04_00785 [Bacteroidales bacterium]